MYTIWLMPSFDNAASLSQHIHELADTYSSPIFEPHITLLGRIEGDEKAIKTLCQQLACRTQFKVTIKKLSSHDTYFRCLFLELNKSKALSAVRQKAEQLFTPSSYSNFRPHCSLLYADISKQKREQLIQDWFKKIDLSSISISKIYLMKTLGKVKDWRILEEWELE